MFTKKSIAIALGAALALGVSGMASATIVTADGIQWDTSSPLNLKVQGIDLRESSISKVGDVLQGYGEIGSINGWGQTKIGTTPGFCVNNDCSLNFTFSYTVKSIDTAKDQIVFDGGTINIYSDSTGSFNENNPATAGIGTLWLSMTGHTAKFQGFSDTGTLFSTVTGSVSQPGTQSGGFGLLDATGGGALPYITPDIYPDGLGGSADFKLSTSFSFQPIIPPICGIVGGSTTFFCFPIAGTGTILNQKKTSVPEPAELGLMGFGLGVLAFFFWRRRKEDEERA